MYRYRGYVPKFTYGLLDNFQNDGEGIGRIIDLGIDPRDIVKNIILEVIYIVDNTLISAIPINPQTNEIIIETKEMIYDSLLKQNGCFELITEKKCSGF